MQLNRLPLLICLLSLQLAPTLAWAQTGKVDTSVGDKMIAEYFRIESQKLAHRTLAGIETLEDWKSKRAEFKSQLLEMLGLDPLPERTDLKATVTGKVEHDEFTVEKLHYQSRPGLYVTANLYVPKKRSGKLPAVLYVCGHGKVKKNGVSYGNKTHYHHHGAWFARNGYVCLTIDTLQLGEIEGIHHGTYREKMWWWLNRGYTPAGVEAWNCVRAIDYLQSRPEVDGERLGVTGRSGGGAYSWWIAAIDERIKCAVPVAGITDLQNHVYDGNNKRFPDGCVEGHCDCMFMVNTHRWDYSVVAAMVAPRPLMISNSDNDTIFPLDGVYRTYNAARKVYSLYGREDKIAFNITAGGHSDTQQLRVNAFDWLNQHLKGKSQPIETVATKMFEPEQLKVFETLPEDELNTKIEETFVAAAKPVDPPKTEANWKELQEKRMTTLRTKVFAGWPSEPEPLAARQAWSAAKDGVTLRAIDFTSQNVIRLRLFVMHKTTDEKPKLVVLNPVDEDGWSRIPADGRELGSRNSSRISPSQLRRTLNRCGRWWRSSTGRWRGSLPAGLARRSGTRQKRNKRNTAGGSICSARALMECESTMCVGLCRHCELTKDMKDVPTWIQAEGTMAGIAAYASLFEPSLARLDLHRPTRRPIAKDRSS